jgi:hypothetical protein
MSLKVFHIIFITSSVVLAFGFAIWSFQEYFRVGGTSNLGFGAASLAVGVGLIFYGKAVWKKLQSITKD